MVFTTAASTDEVPLPVSGDVDALIVTSDFASALMLLLAVRLDEPWIRTAGSALPSTATSLTLAAAADAVSVPSTLALRLMSVALSTDEPPMSMVAPEKLEIAAPWMPDIPVPSVLTVTSECAVRFSAPLSTVNCAPVSVIAVSVSAQRPVVSSSEAVCSDFSVRSPAVRCSVASDEMSELL